MNASFNDAATASHSPIVVRHGIDGFGCHESEVLSVSPSRPTRVPGVVAGIDLIEGKGFYYFKPYGDG